MKKTSDTILTYLGLVISLAIFPLVIAGIGYVQISPLFTGEFTQHLGSIEVSYIQMAKFISQSLPHFSWQPLWYLGYPMSMIYTPLIPLLEFFLNLQFGWSYGHGYRVITAFSYVGGLVTLYYFIRELFKNSMAGFISTLLFGTFPGIVSLVQEEVGNDRFLGELIEPRRFTVLVRWGEGPHITSLLFLPLAGLFYIRFLRNQSKVSFFLGGLFSGLVAMTNSLGAWALAILFISLSVGEYIEKSLKWEKLLVRMTSFSLFAYGIIAFWFNPFFIKNFFAEGSGAATYWQEVFPWGWIVVLVLFILFIFIARLIFKKFTGATASLFFFMVMFSLVNIYYGSGIEKIELVPQVLRLGVEADMGGYFLVGLLISIIGYVAKKKGQLVYGLVMSVFLVAIIPIGVRVNTLKQELPQFVLPLASKNIGLEQIQEFKIAKLLEQKVTGDERVFVTGNYSFYLNYFTDVSQLRGALFQSQVHDWPGHIYYQVTNGEDAQVSRAWLKIANVGWLVYSGPGELYKDYKVERDKFDEVLEIESETDEIDIFYKVPLKDTSLAKAVSADIKSLETPYNAIDEEPIFAYEKILDQQNNVLVSKEISEGKYELSGLVDEGEIVLFQQAYVNGWKARDDQGHRLAVRSDPLGFILIEPNSFGNQIITLSFTNPLEIWIGWIITVLTLGVFMFFLYHIKSERVGRTSGETSPVIKQN